MRKLNEGYLFCNDSGKQTDLHGFYDLSSPIVKVSLKKSLSLGLVVLVEKLFTQTPQSDAIMSAD